MRTESHFYAKHLDVDVEQLNTADLNDEELATIKYYIKITKHMQEINGLFQVFDFNLNSMRHHYAVFNDGTIKRNVEYDFNVSDIVAINALTINLISSGQTLIESIEVFLKKNGEELYPAFKANCLSKEYDECFSYRFLLRLRDYVQHCHLPVSLNFDNKYCFDLNQILFTPRFSHNSRIKSQMADIANEIFEKYSDYPYLALTFSLAEFSVCIIRIYLEFLKKTRDLLHNSVDSIKALINRRPEIIHKSSDCFNGLVLYELDGGTLHLFDPKDNPKKMLSQYKNAVFEILQEEQSKLSKMRSGLKII